VGGVNFRQSVNFRAGPANSGSFCRRRSLAVAETRRAGAVSRPLNFFTIVNFRENEWRVSDSSD
jgi:hypothetical protein